MSEKRFSEAKVDYQCAIDDKGGVEKRYHNDDADNGIKVVNILSQWVDILVTVVFQEKIVSHPCFGFIMDWLR